MKRNLLSGLAAAAAIAGLWFAQGTVGERIDAAAVMAPRFEVDPFWPKPLPHDWLLGSVIGISVDPVVADSGWSPVIGQQRLVSTPLETTYYRFTYPDLQEIPPDGVLLQVVAGRGDAAKGIWVFRLERS